VPRVRRPLLALIALVVALAVGYGIKAARSADSSPRSPAVQTSQVAPRRAPDHHRHGRRVLLPGQPLRLVRACGREPMTGKQDAIRASYAQVAAPQWAAPNLDGLADVLRDLSWLPEGLVPITLPDLSGLSADDRAVLLRVVAGAVNESLDSPRPVNVHRGDH